MGRHTTANHSTHGSVHTQRNKRKKKQHCGGKDTALAEIWGLVPASRGSSQLPVTPVPRDPMPSPGLLGHQAGCGTIAPAWQHLVLGSWRSGVSSKDWRRQWLTQLSTLGSHSKPFPQGSSLTLRLSTERKAICLLLHLLRKPPAKRPGEMAQC